MYTEFFGLNEKPFSITPDPRYLYLSSRHADALAHLLYGISESGGFIQLTGEVGTGKTTLIRSLLEQLPEKAEIALILNPQLSAKEFLQAICQELRIDVPKRSTVKCLIDHLNEHLLRANAEDRRIVLIVDEAQTLSPALLEQVRLLTNLETAKRKLLQIILIGQPELRQLLDRPEMRQVAQRITGRYHLEPLSLEDTFVYVRHRMKVAGAHAEVFLRSAIRELYRQSGGIPRLINVVADRALLAAYTQDRSKIDGKLIGRAASEVFGRRSGAGWRPWAAAALGLAGLTLAVDGLWLLGRGDAPTRVAELGADAAQAGGPMAPPTSLRLPELLASVEPAADPDAAVAALFGLWHIDYDPAAGDACEQAAGQGLRCLYLNGGSIARLRRLNRPAVLSVQAPGGIEHRLAAAKLHGDQLELMLGHRRVRVPIADFEPYGLGQQLVLWKPFSENTDDLALGMSDAAIGWLRENLAALRGANLSGEETFLFDDELETWVKEYQRERTLAVDGIVGAQTQISLRTDLGLADIPLLAEND